MSDSTCRVVDCNNPPKTVTPYPDITGLGVIIGYIASAGIAVVIVLVYYLFAFQPEHYPFKLEDDDSDSREASEYSPNPIDTLLVRYLRKLKLRPKEPVTIRGVNIHEPLQKCILAMSDLQILTGLSILISGFAQLQCGLSNYHWLKVVDLAWFSSLSHLACLTMLRNYLYNRPVERIWRLTAMGVFVILLVVAFIPTGPFGSRADVDSPYNYALCSFKLLENTTGNAGQMVSSILLMTLGYIIRIILLHKYLSKSIFSKARTVLSKYLRSWLQLLWDKIQAYTLFNACVRRFIYHPLLAIFIVGRVTLDLFSSGFLEVGWLVYSFSWGVIRLFNPGIFGFEPDAVIGGGINTQWTFGQVVPVVLLAAPIVSVLESFYSEKRKSASSDNKSCASLSPSNETDIKLDDLTNTKPPQRETTLELAAISAVTVGHYVEDHPNFDYFQKSTWFRSFIIFYLTSIATYSGISIGLGGPTQLALTLVEEYQLGQVFVFDPLSIGTPLVFFVLWSLSIETAKNKWKLGKWPCFALAAINFLYWILMAFTPLLVNIAWAAYRAKRTECWLAGVKHEQVPEGCPVTRSYFASGMFGPTLAAIGVGIYVLVSALYIAVK